MQLFGQKTRAIIQHQADWQQWQNQRLGRTVMQHERSLLTPLLGEKLGSHLLQLSIAGCEPLFDHSPILNKTFAQMSSVGEPFRFQANCDLVIDPCNLPITNNMMDAVVLHHILEYTNNPYQVMREAHRVLTSGGQLFVMGFNPWSLMGVRKVLTPFNKAPWSGSFRSWIKLVDGLKLLGFNVEMTQHAFFELPFNGAVSVDGKSIVERFGRKYNCFFGSTYAIVARKQTVGMEPHNEINATRRGLSFPVTEPTTRSIKTLDEPPNNNLRTHL
jgi:SAM-dependent methyltransferase